MNPSQAGVDFCPHQEREAPLSYQPGCIFYSTVVLAAWVCVSRYPCLHQQPKSAALGHEPSHLVCCLVRWLSATHEECKEGAVLGSDSFTSSAMGMFLPSMWWPKPWAAVRQAGGCFPRPPRLEFQVSGFLWAAGVSTFLGSLRSCQSGLTKAIPLDGSGGISVLHTDLELSCNLP